MWFPFFIVKKLLCARIRGNPPLVWFPLFLAYGKKFTPLRGALNDRVISPSAEDDKGVALDPQAFEKA